MQAKDHRIAKVVLMNSNETKIKMIKDLINDINECSLYFNMNPVLHKKTLNNIYHRSINISELIYYPNDYLKLDLIRYFNDHPFIKDERWLIAIDKLKLFLSAMLEYVQGDANRKTDFWILIHKNIVDISKKKFEDGHYADAVESSFKTINKCVKDIVREVSGNELDGVSLMREAFGFNLEKNRHPIVLLDDLGSDSGRNIQEGYMQLFAGAMQGIRNPKAHDNIKITRERAIHQIFLASLLMFKLDERK
jgi:uncharacterized protein (TIGR02391 family)